MTRDEALQILDTIPTIGEQVDALEMAIKALEQEPCDDAISRQYLLDNCVVDKVTMPYVPANKIKEAPPVNPQEPNCPYYVIDEDGHGLCRNHRVLEKEQKAVSK